MAPGSKQSGGKRLPAPTTKGNTRLRAALAEAVWAISHTKDNYLSAQYHRLARRIGKKKAIVAVEHSILTAVLHMLTHDIDYHDLGGDYFTRLDPERAMRRIVRQANALGFTVRFDPIQAA